MINKIISAGTFEAMDGIREGKNTLREVAGIMGCLQLLEKLCKVNYLNNFV